MSCSAVANLEESPLSDSKMDISDATNSLESTGVSPVVEHPRNNHNSIHSAPTLTQKIPLLMSSTFHSDESQGTGSEIPHENVTNCTTNENQEIQICSNEISDLEHDSTDLHELDNRRINNICEPGMLSLSEKNISGLTVANSHPLMSPNGTDSDSDNSCLVQAEVNRKFHNFPDVIPNRERQLAEIPVQRNNKLLTCETIAGNQRVLPSSLVSVKNNLNSNIAKATVKNKLSVLRAHSPDLLSSGSEAEISQYHATVEPNFQSVALIPNINNTNISNANGHHRKNKAINAVGDVIVGADDISSIDSISNHSFDDDEDLEHNLASLSPSSSLIDGLDDDDDDDDDCEGPEIDDDFPEGTTPTNMKPTDALPQYSAEEERRDSRNWQKITLPDGRTREIDMKVIEPYKRVLSHGGYLKAGGHNAIVIFCACHLPDRSRADYHYVMDNLFLYVVKTLDQLVTEDYVLIYLHGGTSRRNMPPFPWLKKCYQLLDRRLRKSLKNMYLVHPTFWIKSIVWMARPFVSTFYSSDAILKFLLIVIHTFAVLSFRLAMPFQRFVQTGRIAKCAAGPLKGRLVAIVDVIDQNRVLVDGPLTGVPRQEYRLNNLHLTKYRIKFPFTAPTRIVRKAWQDSDLKAQWKVSPWSVKAQNICKRSQLNDFDRFKLRYAKRQRNKLLTIAFNALKKRTKADGTTRVLKKDRRERIRELKAKGVKKGAAKK